MTQDERIEQFRKMAKANPDDDLAHFALGQQLIDAERYPEAANVLRHVIKISPHYSKAYVLLGMAQEAQEDTDGAVETYQQGWAVAMSRGDLMPATEMKSLLTELGSAPSSEALLVAIKGGEEEDDGREPGEGEIRDVRTGRVGLRMEARPFEDELGDFIVEHVTQESWEAWMEMSIKVINEMRLDLGSAHGQLTYDEHMRDFLNMPAHLFEGRNYGE
jgi:Fe-S cluster biosynthesis and repair protein YggX